MWRNRQQRRLKMLSRLLHRPLIQFLQLILVSSLLLLVQRFLLTFSYLLFGLSYLLTSVVTKVPRFLATQNSIQIIISCLGNRSLKIVFSGDLTPAQTLDLLCTKNYLLVDVRSEKEKDKAGIPRLPSSAKNRMIAIP